MTEASLFDLIIHSPESERPAILDRETADQPELRQRVERLVAAHDRRMHGHETRSHDDPHLTQTNADEPRGLEILWKKLAGPSKPSPKLWMDAYLAAFAVAGGYQLVTTDKGFKQFKGLDLLVLPKG